MFVLNWYLTVVLSCMYIWIQHLLIWFTKRSFLFQNLSCQPYLSNIWPRSVSVSLTVKWKLDISCWKKRTRSKYFSTYKSYELNTWIYAFQGFNKLMTAFSAKCLAFLCFQNQKQNMSPKLTFCLSLCLTTLVNLLTVCPDSVI